MDFYTVVKEGIMFKHQCNLRVRYAETDQMGFVYYGVYAAYFEVARVEALRSLDVSYKSIENSGILMPVLNYAISYFKPALYDEELTIETRITQLPAAKIRFDYQTYNQTSELLNEAHTELAFLSAENRKPRRAPEKLIVSLRPYFT